MSSKFQNIKDVAVKFSTGKFNEVYIYLADNVSWIIIGDGANTFRGRQAVMKYCDQVSEYFNLVTTKFTIENVIEENNKVVITGTAEFIRDNKTMSFVQSCDIYHFNEAHLLEGITSYCVAKEDV
jgi:hypothetical protein